MSRLAALFVLPLAFAPAGAAPSFPIEIEATYCWTQGLGCGQVTFELRDDRTFTAYEPGIPSTDGDWDYAPGAQTLVLTATPVPMTFVRYEGLRAGSCFEGTFESTSAFQTQGGTWMGCVAP